MAKGDRVVIDWEGYTIGYYGRPFQTRNKVFYYYIYLVVTKRIADFTVISC